MANKLIELKVEFEALQKKLSKFGSYDSEPCYFFNTLMIRSIKGEPWREVDPESWELYQSVPGWKDAAKQLTSKSKQIFNEVQKAPLIQVVEFQKYYGY